MKKNIFRSLAFAAAFVSVNIVLTSCSAEEFDNENLSVDCVKSLIVCDAPVQTTEVNAEGQGTTRQWTLSDGQVVKARHTGTVDVNNIEIVDINETSGEDDNTTMVNVIVASKSSLNTITRSVSYAKMLKVNPDTVVVVKTDTVVVNPPAPQEPTITNEYFVADTTMTYKTYTSEMVKVTMGHKLSKVTVWSDGREDRTEVWNKSFVVGKTYATTTQGRLYSNTAAKDVNYRADVTYSATEESTDEAFTLTKKKGQCNFYCDYVCDAGYPQTWDAHVVAEVTNVSVSYEGYSASYNFDIKVEKLSQNEDTRNIADEFRTNHTYVYETTSVAKWNVSLNSDKLGVTTNELEIFHF